MALLTTLPFPDAKKLLVAYGLELKDLLPLSAGSVNSNFFLTARGGPAAGERYFARLYEEQDEAGARFEVEVNRALLTANQRVARPVLTKAGEPVLLYRGKPFAVYERLDGEVLCQARVTEAAARSVGGALAGVHLADLGSLPVPEGRFGSEGIRSRLDQVEASARPDLTDAIERARALLSDVEAKRNPGLPSGLTHGDLFRDNVLVSGQSVSGLLDFESACKGAYVYDLMVTILAWCYGDGFQANLVKAMVEGYVRVRPLSAEEVSAMTSEGAFACLRFVATRLTDFSLRVSPGERPVRDFERFFSRMSALMTGDVQRAIEGVVGV
jgi:homoserine kinase type II